MKTILFCSLAMATFGAHAMSFKTEIQPLKIPLMVSTEQPPKISYTPPGEISVGLMRMCGDGDVASFSSDHPDFEFVPQGVNKLQVLIGFWVVEQDETNPVPTSSNFFPVGYRSSTIAENTGSVTFAGDFLPVNKSFSPGPNGMKILATDMINVARIAEKSFGAEKDYRIYAGVSTCVTPDQASTLAEPGSANFKFTPSPVEISYVLSTETSGGLYQQAEDIVEGLDTSSSSSIQSFLNNNGHVTYSVGDASQTIYKGSGYVASTQKPYRFNFGNTGGADLTTAATYSVFKDIAQLPYPDLSSLDESASEEDQLKEYKNKLKFASVSSKLSGMDGLSYCTGLGLATKKDGPQYKWEAFPMNLSCRYLLKSGALKAAYEALYNPLSVPSAESFNSLKKDLAARFYISSVIEAVQKKMHADSDVKIERPSCYKMAGKPVINSLVASYPFEFKKKPSAYAIVPSAHGHLHPEPSFALSNFSKYLSSDKVGIWGQIFPDNSVPNLPDWGMLLPTKSGTWSDHTMDSSTFNAVPITIKFNIRSIGGSCPMFC